MFPVHFLRVLLCLLSTLIATACNTAASKDNDFKLHVFDVREGQSLLLQNDSKGILIDTGHFGQVQSVIDKIRKAGVKKLDYLIFTHLHPDHASGYFGVRDAFPETPVYDNCQPINTTLPDVVPDIVRWVADAIKINEKHSCLAFGQNIKWGDLKISPLWPDKVESGDLNYNSLVLNIEYGKAVVLVMGDATQPVEQLLLQKARVPSEVSVYVAGHHAANDTGDSGFLQRVHPQISIVSVNKNNIRGYPSKETIKRMNASSGMIYRTDLDGDLCFSLKKETKLSEKCTGNNKK